MNNEKREESKKKEEKTKKQIKKSTRVGRAENGINYTRTQYVRPGIISWRIA